MPFCPHRLTLATALLSVAAFAACAGDEQAARMTADAGPPAGSSNSSANPSVNSPETAQLIVKFRAGAGDPTDPAFLKKVTAAAQVTHAELVRPMSGGAYVLRISCAAGCDAAIARLRAGDLVEYVDRDSIQHHQ